MMSDQVKGQCARHVLVLVCSFLYSPGEEVPSGVLGEFLYMGFLI